MWTSVRRKLGDRGLGRGASRPLAVLLFGTGLIAATMPANTSVRDHMAMQIGVQVIDDCTVGTLTTSQWAAANCASDPLVSAPRGNGDAVLAGKARKSPIASFGEQMDDGYTTFVF